LKSIRNDGQCPPTAINISSKMNRKLTTILITGFIIEILCLAIAYSGDIKKNIPCFAILYTASFITYIFAIFYISKNAETMNRRITVQVPFSGLLLFFL